MSAIIVHTHHLLQEGSQADSKQQPPRAEALGQRTQQRAELSQQGKLSLKWQPCLQNKDVLQVRGLRKSRQIEEGRQIKMLEQVLG